MKCQQIMLQNRHQFLSNITTVKFGSKLGGLPSACWSSGDEHKNLDWDSPVYPIEKGSAVRCQECATNIQITFERGRQRTGIYFDPCFKQKDIFSLSFWRSDSFVFSGGKINWVLWTSMFIVCYGSWQTPYQTYKVHFESLFFSVVWAFIWEEAWRA